LLALDRHFSKIVLWGAAQDSEDLRAWCYDFEWYSELIPVSFGAEEMLWVTESWVAGAWTENGYLLDMEEHHAEALACHDRAIAIDPMCSTAWINRGLSLDELGRRSDAIASYDRAIEINPLDWTPWVRKGDILDRVGQSEQAILCFDSALAMRRDIVPGWMGR